MKSINKKTFKKGQFEKELKAFLAKYDAKSHIIFLEFQDGSGPCYISGEGGTILSMAVSINEQVVAKTGSLGALMLLASLTGSDEPTGKSAKKQPKRK